MDTLGTKSEWFTAIERNFKELIIRRCKFCRFDRFLEENPEFEFPKVTEGLVGSGDGRHITIPGLFGGFDYFLEEMDGRFVLYAEQSSRMDHDSSDYLYFEVTADGSRKLEGEEREAVRGKFRELAKRAREEHLRRATEAMKRAKDQGAML